MAGERQKEGAGMKELAMGEPSWMVRVAATVWRKLRRSVKRRGVMRTVGYSMLIGPTKLACKVGLVKMHHNPSVANVFDQEHGVETAAHVPVNQLGVDSKNLPGANPYAPTSPKYFKEMMSHLSIRHQDYTFVDIGCGKGLVLLLASAYPFCQIIGVELSHELIAVANRNIEAYAKSPQVCRKLRCVCMDAVLFPLPSDPLVIFFYNSFSGKVLRQFAANVARTLGEHHRDIYLVYNNPTEPEVFDAIPTLERVVDDPDYTIHRTRAKEAGRA